MNTAAATKPMMAVTRVTVLEEVARQRAEEASSLDFDQLYRDYKRKVYATVNKVVGYSDELDDIVQVVFLEIHRSLPKYKGNSKLSTWIYRIAVNVALQHIRKKKRRRVFLFFKDEERQVENIGFDPRGRYQHRDVMKRLYALLDKLTEKKRVVFVLHELEGMPLEEVASVCQIPVNTVRSRLHAARTELLGRMHKAGIMEKAK